MEDVKKVKTSNICSLEQALELYEKNSEWHGIGSNEGNRNMCNLAYSNLRTCYYYLKERNMVNLLEILLQHEDCSVRLWSAYALLPVTKEAKEVIEKISKKNTIIGFDAEMTLIEWKKGRLKIF